MKKRSTAGGRRHFAVLLLFILGMIAVFTCISVTMGAVEISPVNIVKIIINKSFGREIFDAAWAVSYTHLTLPTIRLV